MSSQANLSSKEPQSQSQSQETHTEFTSKKSYTEESRALRFCRYCKRNPNFLIGLTMLISLLLYSFVGRIFWSLEMAEPLSGIPSMPPSLDHPFGTDTQGRDVLAITMAGTWLTIRTGVLAAGLGTVIGCVLGFLAGFLGGWVDNLINWAVDVLLTVPAILVLVVIASSVQGQLSSLSMAFIIALLAWRRPTRQIRSQVLILRNMGYVNTARISGMGNLEIIFRELMPNLLPYLVSVFVMAVSAAILAAVGLQAMGLGPQNEPTLGMTVYWIMYYSAFLQGLWWWIIPPISVLVVLFVGFYLFSEGLDEFSNPRIRARGN
tara:strand:+ start:791 stop:1750 length:960 start_codon:yes stop_codon:yes gene_type:complete